MATPLRVLVVEDEMTIALFIEDMLNELGHEVVGLAMRLSPALILARDSTIDFAILDVNLDGKRSFSVAEILEDRGVPFAFATGYGPSGIDPRFKNHPVLRKPFEISALETVLTARA
jgi:DNA-binding response OmpR family regulator